jgi:hypothetical protein
MTDTGLPELQEGFWWEVQQRSHRRDDHNIYTNWGELYDHASYKVSIMTAAAKKNRPAVEVESEIVYIESPRKGLKVGEDVSMDYVAPVFYTDLTEESIRVSADRLMAKLRQREKSRIEQEEYARKQAEKRAEEAKLLGAYPPKRLGKG